MLYLCSEDNSDNIDDKDVDDKRDDEIVQIRVDTSPPVEEMYD